MPDAEAEPNYLLYVLNSTTDPSVRRNRLVLLELPLHIESPNGKPHGWDSTAERLIRDNLTSRVDQETPRYAFESSRAHGSIVGEKHTAVYQ